MSQSTVSRTVEKVCIALAKRKNNFIKFPTGGRAEWEVQNFYDIAGFPEVVGSIDCTHVRISNPGGEEAQRFIN